MLPAQTDLTQTDSNRVDCSQDPLFGQDKFVHAGLSMGWVVGLDQIEGINTPSAVASGLVIGLFKEIYDRKYGSGCFSFRDLVADVVGISVGLLILTGMQK